MKKHLIQSTGIWFLAWLFYFFYQYKTSIKLALPTIGGSPLRSVVLLLFISAIMAIFTSLLTVLSRYFHNQIVVKSEIAQDPLITVMDIIFILFAFKMVLNKHPGFAVAGSIVYTILLYLYLDSNAQGSSKWKWLLWGGLSVGLNLLMTFFLFIGSTMGAVILLKILKSWNASG